MKLIEEFTDAIETFGRDSQDTLRTVSERIHTAIDRLLIAPDDDAKDALEGTEQCRDGVEAVVELFTPEEYRDLPIASVLALLPARIAAETEA